MEWWQMMILIFSIMFLLMATNYPITFVFITLNIGMFYYLLNGMPGIEMFVVSMYDSLFSFTLIAVPMFILMGEVLFHSGAAFRAINALDKLLGKMPGRLAILASMAGILFGAVSGSMMGNVAMLGSTLGPEMEKRGYAKTMIFGPIMGVGSLAIIIPPSAIGVLYASIAQISVGKVLIGGVIPGLILGMVYMVQIIIRVKINPSLAPIYDVDPVPMGEKIKSIIFDVAPLGIVIFAVIGTIILGLATPSEAAALGALGAFLLSVYNRTFGFQLIKKAAFGTFKTTGMVFAIVAATVGFGQMLALTGIVDTMVEFATSFQGNPLVILILMEVLVFGLGCFVEIVPLMMITIPIFFPIITQLGFDPIWFAVINIINLEVASITPPFGMLLFVMKAVSPKGTKMADIYKSVGPFVLCDIFVMILLFLIPPLITWLPSLIYQ